MYDEEEKSTGVVAYLSYVRVLWVVSDDDRRKIAQFLIFENNNRYRRLPHPIVEKGDENLILVAV